jgi:hydroxymethylpyrimidine/phosphomethylpyrimidine kinase
MTSVALTIAGSDPSGGAGIQADLKTFHQHGVFGTSVLTLLTVQNTRGVDEIHLLEPKFIRAQLDAVLADIPPVAAKTGAMGDAMIIETVAERAASFGFPLVVDPVMISKHGHPLIDKEAVGTMRKALVPRAFLLTPNMHEATLLSEIEVNDVPSMEKAAALIALRGVPNVLIKGGRLEAQSVDILWSDGESHRFTTPRVDTNQTHGSGCVLSAAITARIARGETIESAVQGAKAFVTHAIQTAPRLGEGQGPVNFHADVPETR